MEREEISYSWEGFTLLDPLSWSTLRAGRPLPASDWNTTPCKVVIFMRCIFIILLQTCVWYPDRWWVCRHWRIWRVFRGLGSEEGHQLQQDRTQQVSGWSQCCSLLSRLWEVWEWWGSHCEFYIEKQLMLKFITMQVLLVTGGQQWSGNSSIPLDSTEILETNTWRISAPLPSARYGLKAASLGNTIFLYGEEIISHRFIFQV